MKPKINNMQNINKSLKFFFCLSLYIIHADYIYLYIDDKLFTPMIFFSKS